mgnify:CR=1 FL=1
MPTSKTICVPSCDLTERIRNHVNEQDRRPLPQPVRPQVPSGNREDFKVGVAFGDIPAMVEDTKCCRWSPGQGWVTIHDRGTMLDEFCPVPDPSDPNDPGDAIEFPSGSGDWYSKCEDGNSTPEADRICLQGSTECWGPRGSARSPYRALNFDCLPIPSGAKVWMHREFQSGQWVAVPFDPITHIEATNPELITSGATEDVTVAVGSEVVTLRAKNRSGEDIASGSILLLHRGQNCEWFIDCCVALVGCGDCVDCCTGGSSNGSWLNTTPRAFVITGLAITGAWGYDPNLNTTIQGSCGNYDGFFIDGTQTLSYEVLFSNFATTATTVDIWLTFSDTAPGATCDFYVRYRKVVANQCRDMSEITVDASNIAEVSPANQNCIDLSAASVTVFP